jgi:hypothetical protein
MGSDLSGLSGLDTSNLVFPCDLQADGSYSMLGNSYTDSTCKVKKCIAKADGSSEWVGSSMVFTDSICSCHPLVNGYANDGPGLFTDKMCTVAMTFPPSTASPLTTGWFDSLKTTVAPESGTIITTRSPTSSSLSPVVTTTTMATTTKAAATTTPVPSRSVVVSENTPRSFPINLKADVAVSGNTTQPPGFLNMTKNQLLALYTVLGFIFFVMLLLFVRHIFFSGNAVVPKVSPAAAPTSSVIVPASNLMSS